MSDSEDTKNYKRNHRNSQDQEELDRIMAKYPGFQDVWSPDMAMGPELQQKMDAIQLDKRGINKFRDEALRSGPSAWQSLAMKNQDLSDLTARERGAKEVAGTAATARGQLAMRGGIRSGARERIARQGQRDYLAMSQDTNRQSDANKLQIQMNDETNRIQQLGMLPGMEVQSLQPDFQKLTMWGQGKQFDTTNQMGNKKGKNDYEQKKYEEYMKGYAANKDAQGQEDANDK